MRNEILSSINQPAQLEKLYRADKQGFARSFNAIYPELGSNPIAMVWYERLNYGNSEGPAAGGRELGWVLVGSLVAFLIAKVPAFTGMNEERYYMRNIGFIIFPVLAFYFARKNKLSSTLQAIIGGAMLLSLLFINLLPNEKNSDTLILSCIHLVLFLWSLLGISFAGGLKNEEGRLDYLKYNGDLVVMTTLIGITFALMTAITINLFLLIGINIGDEYMRWIGVLGASSAPIVATYLIRSNPQLVGRVSPVIAKIFSPLVLFMLLVYLGAMVLAKKDPYNDREFLMVFNALLIGVMAIIFFSVSDASKERSKPENWILLLLSLFTIIVNGVALSAIIFRISTLGITPNRAAIMGGNILILINLIMVAVRLFQVVKGRADVRNVGSVIARYLPVYVAWTVIVTFLFPILFGLK